MFLVDAQKDLTHRIWSLISQHFMYSWEIFHCNIHVITEIWSEISLDFTFFVLNLIRFYLLDAFFLCISW